jgi:hypothetical protein
MKTFDIKQIKPNLSFKIEHKNMALPSVHQFRAHGYKVDFEVFLEEYGINLQRPVVWTEFQRQQFILSILKNVNIPQFAAVVYTPDNEHVHQIYKIIDGKQRLTSLFDFVDNKFPIPCKDELFFFEELPKDIQLELMRWNPQGQIAYSYFDDKISDAALIQWFRLLNFAGTSQDKEHLTNLINKL